MRPHEFTDRLRPEIERKMLSVRNMVNDLLSTPDDSRIEAFTKDPGSYFAMHGFVDDATAARLNRVVFALLQSNKLTQHADRIADKLSQDARAKSMFQALANHPASLDERTTREVLDSLLNDDSVLTGTLRVIMTDNVLRKAMGVRPELTFDEYIQGVRKAIRDSQSLDQISASAAISRDLPVAFCTEVAACVAVAALVTVAAVVHAVVGAVTYAGAYAVVRAAAVFTASGNAPDIMWTQRPSPSYASRVVNSCGDVAWIVIRCGQMRKRVPLTSGSSTTDLGLERVEAILIGGARNPIDRIATPTGIRDCGAYIISDVTDYGPATVALLGGDSIRLSRNRSQIAAECAGAAGYRGPGDGVPSMANTAAAFPSAIDIQRLSAHSQAAASFYTALRMLDSLRLFRQSA
jgi:hypothetical protein